MRFDKNFLNIFSVIVDADPTGNSCHDALFNIGGGTTSRSWNILVTQYACGDYDNSGYVHFLCSKFLIYPKIPLNLETNHQREY